MKSEHYQHLVEHGEYTELASHNTLSHLFLDTLQYENSRYLYNDMKNVLKVQEIDPDLASLPQNDISAILHMLFVVSGCDYISYFMGFGKGMFLNTFYQYAEFISGKNSTGYLCHITEDSKRTGFLSFLRLIGSLYF